MVGLAETQFDLKFRLLGVPVRVHPLFWIIAAVMGWRDNDLPSVLLWVGCVFISILVHEFGHALTGRAFNGSPSVVLWGMGGLCYSQGERQTPGQRLLVLLAGPGAGFLLLALVILLTWPIDQAQLCASLLGFGVPAERVAVKLHSVFSSQEQLKFAVGFYFDMVQINFFWGLVNLLPIWPLDGGQVAQVLLSLYDRHRGQRWSHVLSLLVAGVLALVVYQFTKEMFLTVFFGYFAFINFQVLQTLQQAHSMGVYEEDEWWKK
jgi:stage IV sporulation protein FB